LTVQTGITDAFARIVPRRSPGPECSPQGKVVLDCQIYGNSCQNSHCNNYDSFNGITTLRYLMTMTTSSGQNILIAGAGLMGQLLAWRLLLQGHRVTLYEAGRFDRPLSA